MMIRCVLLCFIVTLSTLVTESYAEDKTEKKGLSVEFPAEGIPAGSLAGFYKVKKIVWLGIDFRKVKFIGMDIDFEGPEMLRLKYVPIWNYLVKKYDRQFSDSFGIESENMPVDYGKMVDLNGGVAGFRIIPENEKMEPLTLEQMGELVKYYSTDTGVETGAAIIVDEFNFPEKRAIMHLVLLDMKTKEIIFSVRGVYKPGGIYVGMYWFSAIRRMMKDIHGQYGGYKTKNPSKEEDSPFDGRF